MKNRLLITAPLALALVTGPATARPAEPQTPPRVTRPAPRPSFAESTRRNLQRIGATVDDSKSTPDMVVSGYLDEKGAKTTIGSFFVDGDDDIGYKYLVNGWQTLPQASFESVYRTMVSVARDRRPEIREMIAASGKDESAGEANKGSEEKPPGI
jgi:hypothetical protein